MPELVELVETYKPAVIWSDGAAGMSSSNEMHVLESLHRTGYLLGLDWISRLVIQRKSSERYSCMYMVFVLQIVHMERIACL